MTGHHRPLDFLVVTVTLYLTCKVKSLTQFLDGCSLFAKPTIEVLEPSEQIPSWRVPSNPFGSGVVYAQHKTRYER